MPNDIPISADSLDKKLRVLETNFEKKLTAYFDSFEKSINNQVVRFRDSEKDLTLPKQKLEGLTNLYKNHFKQVEKISADYAKNDMIKLEPDSKKEILSLRTEKINEANIKYAKDLAKKQYDDYLEKSNKVLREAIKQNKEIKANQLKELIKESNEKFKNQRVKATSQTEANRVMNETKAYLIDKSNLGFKYKFICVIDDRTTKEICLPRHNLVFTKDTLKRYRNQLLPCLHVNCRSQLMPTRQSLTSLDRLVSIIRKYPSLK